ncbi:MAG: hypothetical protein GEV03_21475 [Streptosporangiales bacterium]|nr:hypothetical protein [Streptosporangiales bacterium]
MGGTEGGPKRRSRPNGLYWLAVAVFVAMVLVNFPFWLDGRVEPVVLGLPITFTYHVAYCIAAVPVLWLLFRAIWPPTDD